jgi:hypothetical protein
MGLEGIEITLRVEETFGIAITDEEAAAPRTIGDLYDLVLRKVKHVPPDQCHTAKIFYRLRRGLIKVTECRRETIRPDTPLENILPAAKRRSCWPRLGMATGLEMPHLCRPAWLRALLIATVLVLAGLVAVRVRGFPFPLAAAALCVLVPAAVLLSRPLATVVPGCTTVGDLARALLAAYFRTLPPNSRIAGEKEIWNMLVHIIAEEIGIEESGLSPQLRFREDLNF